MLYVLKHVYLEQKPFNLAYVISKKNPPKKTTQRGQKKMKAFEV